MAFSLEEPFYAILSFFSRRPPMATQTSDLPAPPTSAFAASQLPPESSAVSSSSSAEPTERDFASSLSPQPQQHHHHPCCRRPSMASSTASSAATSSSSDLQLDDGSGSSSIKMPQNLQRTNASTTTISTTTTAAAAAHQDDNPVRPAGPRRSATEVVALDAMSRSFPKPAHEPSLDELLARPPAKWSLGHYVKNAREVAPLPADPAQRARQFEDAKRELLRAKAEMEGRAWRV